jgi:hypothetical protein
MLRERDVRRVITVSLSAVMERAHPVCAWRVSTCAVVMRAVNALLDCLSANSKGTVVMVRKERFFLCEIVPHSTPLSSYPVQPAAMG